MKSLVFMAVALFGFAAAVQEKAAPEKAAQEKAAQEKTAYSIKGEAFEACECQTFCPCVWSKDASFGECRGTAIWTVASGSYGKTDLKGCTFAIAVTKSGRNMVKGLGQWEGVLYVTEKATPEQRAAIEAIVKAKWGAGFAKLDVKSAPVETKIAGDRRELAMGKIATVKIAAVKNPDGTTPAIENPPFSLYPKLYCAQAEVHTYDDAAKWDFAGHNAFFGPFDYASK